MDIGWEKITRSLIPEPKIAKLLNLLVWTFVAIAPRSKFNLGEESEFIKQIRPLLHTTTWLRMISHEECNKHRSPFP
jgi:hypothetical protein